MPPTSQFSNNQKVSELEEAISAVSSRVGSLAEELRDSQKGLQKEIRDTQNGFQQEIRDPLKEIRDSLREFRESLQETNKRQERMEAMFRQFIDSKPIQTYEGRGKRVETQSQNLQINNLDSLEDCCELPESSNSLELRKEDRDCLVRKLEMPIFEGVDAFGWIVKMERFFKVGCYDDREKMRTVYMSLDGRALTWYNWYTNRIPFLSWLDFRMKLLSRFGSASAGSPNQRLFGLKQKGSVDDYIHEFEDLSSQVGKLDDINLEAIFLNGLKPEIQDLVLMLKPIGLTKVIDAALRVEPRQLCKVIEAQMQQENKNFRYSAPYTQSSSYVSNPQPSWRVRTITSENTARF